MFDIGILSNAAGALFFFLLALLLLPGWRFRLINSLLLFSCLVSVVWLGLLAGYYAGGTYSLRFLQFMEVIRDFGWLTFLAGVLVTARPSKDAGRVGLIFLAAAVVAGVCSLQAVLVVFPGLGYRLAALLGSHAQPALVGFLVVSIVGLLLIEQVYRNTRPEHRWAIKFLCFGIGGLFAYDFFLYSNAILVQQIDPELWLARGIVNALAVPLIAVSSARNPQWKLDLFVSRQIVFHSTTAIAAGIYLLAMSAAGYYIRNFGGSWGSVLQATFFFAALLILVILIFSTQLQRRVKVFVTKHFYRNKYDYREEWLRFTHTLSNAAQEKDTLYRVVIDAIAGIVKSAAGMLWLRDDEASMFRLVAASNRQMPHDPPDEPHDSAFIRFLTDTGWVINLADYREGKAEYEDLLLPEWFGAFADMELVVPLKDRDDLIGFVLLSAPKLERRFDWEDSDLLKTVGRQAASYLALLQVTDAYAQSRQFETFNRLSAYVVHDLKNLVAQLSLIGSNAQRHKDNPQFVEDAFGTVRDAVAKMSRMLEHLRDKQAADDAVQFIKVVDSIQEIIKRRSAQRPAPTLEIADTLQGDPQVRGNHDRFMAVLEHLVQNAQDATPADGHVTLRLRQDSENRLIIEIADSGGGMDSAFIRERLFKPFDTTKGNAGMGIGAFESREFVRAIGGTLTVASRIGEGTCFTIQLPLAAARSAVTPEQAVMNSAVQA